MKSVENYQCIKLIKQINMDRNNDYIEIKLGLCSAILHTEKFSMVLT